MGVKQSCTSPRPRCAASSSRGARALNAVGRLEPTASGSPRQSAGYVGASHEERLTTTVGSATTTWTNSPLGETNSSTGSGSSLVSYVRDPGGQLIGIRVGTSTNATRYYYTFDGLGSITGLTDSTGARINTYRYDPYGQILSSTEGLPQPFRFTGGIQDSATGLTKLGIRYYDPALGRFTQPDPTGQDPHYTYAGNSPISFTDPSGAIAEWLDFVMELGNQWDNVKANTNLRVGKVVSNAAKESYRRTRHAVRRFGKGARAGGGVFPSPCNYLEVVCDRDDPLQQA